MMTPYRSAAALAFITTLLLIWINVIQMSDGVNPAASRFFLVPIIGFVAAAFQRFRAVGMARVLFATAIVQWALLALAMSVRFPEVTTSVAGVWRGFAINAFFGFLYFVSSKLFQKAGRELPEHL